MPRPDSTASPQRPHVFVIDDDASVLALLHDALADDGWRVEVSRHLPDIDRVRSLAPHLVVLDLRFRGGDDGLALLRDIRRDAALAQTPIIVCSAAADLLRDEAATLADLRADVVGKPFDLDDLLRRVGQRLAAGRV